MTALKQINQQTLDNLATIQESINALKLELESLNDRFVEQSKHATAQANLTKQWTEAIAPLKQLLIEACAVYQDSSVLDAMIDDISVMADDVKNNFDQHKDKPSKFLDEAKPITEFAPALPTVQDMDEEETNFDNPLTKRQAADMVKSLNTELLKRLSAFEGFGQLSAVSSIAKAIVDNKMTRSQLEQDIKLLMDRYLNA